MTLLAIETATTVCGVALIRSSTVIAQRHREEKFVHAGQVLPMVDAVLREGKTEVASLDAIAVSIGPGSFTGLRIGLSLAKGLCAAVGCRIVAVPTLEALAHHALGSGLIKEGSILVPVLRARKGEVYAQSFIVHGGRLDARGEPFDCTITDLPARIGPGEIVVVGEGAEDVLPGMNVQSLAHDWSRCDARSIGLLGESLALQGHAEDPAGLAPRYIKEFFLRHRSQSTGT